MGSIEQIAISLRLQAPVKYKKSSYTQSYAHQNRVTPENFLLEGIALPSNRKGSFLRNGCKHVVIQRHGAGDAGQFRQGLQEREEAGQSRGMGVTV